MTVPIYDYDKRHWRRIYSTEERNERALKALKLNNAVSQNATTKATITIKRFSFSCPGSFKLKGAYSLQEQREKAEKALRLYGVVLDR